MASRWFYTTGGNEFGPVAGAVLRRLVNAGKLLPTDLVMKEGTDQWWPAGSVKGLFPTPVPSLQESPKSKEGEEGRLELPGFDRFFYGHRWGFITMLLSGFALMLLFVFIMPKSAIDEKDRYGKFVIYMWGVLNLIWFFIIAVIWLLGRGDAGRKTACPRCAAWFSKLLIDSKVTVLDSQEETRQYTALKAIRDDRLRIVGFVDEERTRTVISRIVQLDRKYRCKTCGHRWETSDIETLVT